MKHKNITIKECVDKKVWVNMKGELISILNMSDEYILNCVNFLEKEHNYFETIKLPEVYKEFKIEYIKIFEEESNIRYVKRQLNQIMSI